MKYILLVIVVVFISINSFANNDLTIKAEKLYSQKNYKEAITCYQTIIQEGFISYKLYYNLGNAYYKNNELGNAIYYYELANKLKPNQEDVLNNLRIANSKTIDKIESKENFFLSTIKSGLVNSLSPNKWAWLSIVSLVVSLTLLFLFFSTQHIALKRIGFFLGSLSLIIFIGAMILGFVSLNDKEKTNFAVIINRESKIHEEPTKSSGSKFSLHQGTKVSVLETNTDWTNIKLENGNEGWIETENVGLF